MYVSTVKLETAAPVRDVPSVPFFAIGAEYITSLLQGLPGVHSYATLWKY